MKKTNQIKIGIALMLLSGVAFAFMLVVPFFKMSTEYKVIGSSTAFVAMEVLFWTGGLLVGKELFKKYKGYLNPKNWLKRQKEK